MAPEEPSLRWRRGLLLALTGDCVEARRMAGSAATAQQWSERIREAAKSMEEMEKARHIQASRCLEHAMNAVTPESGQAAQE